MKGRLLMLRRIFSYSGQYKKYLVLAALCITCESLFELLIPLIIADIVDVGVASGDTAYIFQKGGCMPDCSSSHLRMWTTSRFHRLLPG